MPTAVRLEACSSQDSAVHVDGSDRDQPTAYRRAASLTVTGARILPCVLPFRPSRGKSGERNVPSPICRHTESKKVSVYLIVSSQFELTRRLLHTKRGQNDARLATCAIVQKVVLTVESIRSKDEESHLATMGDHAYPQRREEVNFELSSNVSLWNILSVFPRERADDTASTHGPSRVYKALCKGVEPQVLPVSFGQRVNDSAHHTLIWQFACFKSSI